MYLRSCVCVCVRYILFLVPVGVCVCPMFPELCVLVLQPDTWMTDDPVGDTSHPAQPESCPPPHQSPSLLKKSILCLLPRLLAINPGSTSNVALPPFPRVTALSTITIAASLRVCVRENEPAATWLHACLSIAEGGGGWGGLTGPEET